MTRSFKWAVVLVVTLGAGLASAQHRQRQQQEEEESRREERVHKTRRATETKPKPAPYSLPWQLRSVVASNIVRSDTAIALQSPEDVNGVTVATMLFASYKLTPNFAPLIRLGFVHNDPPVVGASTGQSFVNPVVGGNYTFNLSPELKLNAFLGLTIPVGMGGGNTPNQNEAVAARSGILARSAMDNAMFAVNDFTVFPGLGLAYTKYGLTVQVEATLLQLTRVRGEEQQPDASRTNFTTGIHVGYFFHPMVSAGTELRYQRWINPATGIEGTPGMDNLTFAIGPRFHFNLGNGQWLRPGIAYATAFDDPMNESGYHIIQVDIPFAF